MFAGANFVPLFHSIHDYEKKNIPNAFFIPIFYIREIIISFFLLLIIWIFFLLNAYAVKCYRIFKIAQNASEIRKALRDVIQNLCFAKVFFVFGNHHENFLRKAQVYR